MGPIVEKLVEELGIDFEKIDASEDYEIADKYDISVVPTFVILKDDEETARKTGGMSGPQFKKWLEGFLDG